MKECQECKHEYVSKDKRQKFCSRSCAASYNNRGRIVSNETRYKISQRLKKDDSYVKEYYYSCEKCDINFIRKTYIKKGHKIHCDQCKQVRNIKDIYSLDSILRLSKQTRTKIFKRLNVGCSECGWDKTICDLHHILPKSKGGGNEHSNLSYLCPNCHRMAHKKLLSDCVSLDNFIGEVWREYYNVT